MTPTTAGRPLRSVAIESALLIAIATTGTSPPQYWGDCAPFPAFRIAPTASFFSPITESAYVTPLATAQEMIANLRMGGLPISAIADSMRVERKTVYAWLSGGDVRSANIQRVAMVHTLLTGVPNVDVRGLYRFWNTALDGRKTLRDLITAEDLDELTTRVVLENLRDAALRAMATERRMSQHGSMNELLDGIPEAGVNG